MGGADGGGGANGVCNGEEDESVKEKKFKSKLRDNIEVSL